MRRLKESGEVYEIMKEKIYICYGIDEDMMMTKRKANVDHGHYECKLYIHIMETARWS